MTKQTQAQRDVELAQKAKAHGARYSLRIVREARRAKLPISLGFALVEQESGFSNVFGHDPTIFCGHGQVTEKKYRAYLAKRGRRGEGGMQGVGPCQLTFWTKQDRADKLGGCWRPQFNMRVAFEDLASLIREHGEFKALGIYNAGAGGFAKGLGHDYARSVQRRQAKWHGRLT